MSLISNLRSKESDNQDTGARRAETFTLRINHVRYLGDRQKQKTFVTATTRSYPT